uniref:Gag/pol protein n=1 Tax=Nicotiana tabacum TaxID=4097 RepID=A0A1S4B5X2_TOBAC|nr:PREDICTED: uncharacterized protein LOC107804848 [Nicotiana tabacum]
METQSSENQNDHIQTPEVDFDIPLSSGRNVNRLNIPQEQVPAVILPQSSGSHVEQTAQQEEVVDIPEDSMETQVPDDVVVQPQNQSDVFATGVVRSRSGRDIRQPVCYTLLGESYDRIPKEPTSEPVNYDQALHDKDADKWVAAMKSEMESMFSMHDSKKGFLPFIHGISLSKDQSPKTDEEIEKMKAVPYASAVGSLMYVKHIIKYLKRTRDYMLIYHSDDLVPIGYTDSDFQSDRDSRKSTSGNVFTLGGGAISWRSIKQSCVADSTMEAEYVAASEAAKEAAIGNNVGMLNSVKQWLFTHFDMKDLGEAAHILGDQTLARSQENDIRLVPRHGISLSKDQSPKIDEEIEKMKGVPYASAVGSLMYAMLCTRPDICFAVGVVSRFQSNPGKEHWTAVKHIIKYLKRTRDYMLIYQSDDLVPIGYTDSDFQSDRDSRKS